MDEKENAWRILVNALIDYNEFEPDLEYTFFELRKEIEEE